MNPTEVNKMAADKALEQSSKAYASGRVLFIHYKCDAFETMPCRIRFIAVKDPSTGTDDSFPAMKDEKKELQRFKQFVLSHPDHLWICWNMRNERYGFPHLNQRLEAHGESAIPEPSIVDLGIECWRKYGDAKTDKPKLIALAECNGISTMGLMEQSEADTANINQLQGDAFRRIEIIYSLWQLMLEDKLQLPAGRGPVTAQGSSPEERLRQLLTSPLLEETKRDRQCIVVAAVSSLPSRPSHYRVQLASWLFKTDAEAIKRLKRCEDRLTSLKISKKSPDKWNNLYSSAVGVEIRQLVKKLDFLRAK